MRQVYLMSDTDPFLKALNSDPIQIEYKVVSARKILSGQVKLPSRYGSGILNELVVKEGEVLSGNVKVLFAPYKETLFFHIRDRLLVETVLSLVRHKYDDLTSNGLCIKPIYSRPSGYIHESGTKDHLLYTYDLTSLISGRKASLPYYLYVNNADGGELPAAVPILAHRVNVHIYKEVYLQFKPNNISISEVIDICKLKYEDSKEIIQNTYWGIEEGQTIQPLKGRFKRQLSHVDFRLSDLLSHKSYLPAECIAGKYYITQPITILTATTSYPFENGTPLTTLWNKWKTLSGDTDCVCSQKYTNLCIFNASLLAKNEEILPSIKGLVTSHRVVIEFTNDTVLCYEENTLIQDILWNLHRLNKGNNPDKYKYTFIHRISKQRVRPTKVYKNIFLLLEDFDDTITENCLLLLDPSCMPMPIPNGTTVREAEKVYTKVIAQLQTKKQKDNSIYRMWKNAVQ